MKREVETIGKKRKSRVMNNKTNKTRQDNLFPINENLQRPVNTAGQAFGHKYRKL